MSSYYQNSLELDRIRRAKERKKANARAAFLARVDALGFAPEGSSARTMLISQYDDFKNDLTPLLGGEAKRVGEAAFAQGVAAERARYNAEISGATPAASSGDNLAWAKAHGMTAEEFARYSK